MKVTLKILNNNLRDNLMNRHINSLATIYIISATQPWNHLVHLHIFFLSSYLAFCINIHKL